MAYTTGGLIQAQDYNWLTWGGNTATYTNAVNNLAYIWGTGSGFKGYGQTTSLITPVTAVTTITATQWAGLVYTVNKALGHQSGAAGQLATGSNIGITAGATVTAFSNVSTAITSTIHTNANLFSTSGSTVTGGTFSNTISFADSIVAYSAQWSRTITFASADQARYFFNSGGKIQLVITATNVNGTARSGDFVTLWQSQQGGQTISGSTNTKSGTGGTIITNATTLGYWNLTSSDQTLSNLTPASATYTYNNDWTRITLRTNGVQGANGDKGTQLIFTFVTSTPAQTNSNFNDAVNVTVSYRFDIIQPETTYLANTWGIITSV